jgi:hypothetical protein
MASPSARADQDLGGGNPFPPPSTLDGILTDAWERLRRGTVDRRSAFHAPTIATVDAAGAPRARTMILRGVDAPGWRLRLHTDRRAPKVTELDLNPRLAVHVYDPGAKLQVRLEGTGRVLTEGPEVEAAWAGSRPQSRDCYRVTDPPSTPIEAGDAWAWGEVDGRASFAILMVEVHAVEWLYLAINGHRRARFLWRDDGGIDSTWLVP